MPDRVPTAFAAIKERASCPFAARARIHAAEPFGGPDARAAGAAVMPLLVEFAERVERDELDGFLIELTDPVHGKDVDALAAATREVVMGLLEAAGVSSAEALRDAGQVHWWLTLLDTRWFVLAFAPCYPASSPRATLSSPSTFLLLQPVASFDRHATPRGTVIPLQVRRAIQQAYAESGRPYDVLLALQDVEALKFVWPLPGDEARPVHWWVPLAGSEDAR
jgi:hypothetical protein